MKKTDKKEGSNSPNQESGLNREMAGNNTQCKIICVSDSATSTGGKESESEGDELNHKTSKREQRRILRQDIMIWRFFVDITRNGIGMNVELGNSLILFHQNIKGLSSKIPEFISLLTLDGINPQFLCFSEHPIL
jgi:hypothetical protein